MNILLELGLNTVGKVNITLLQKKEFFTMKVYLPVLHEAIGIFIFFRNLHLHKSLPTYQEIFTIKAILLMFICHMFKKIYASNTVNFQIVQLFHIQEKEVKHLIFLSKF